MDSGADISPCTKYRYRLWRLWDHSCPVLGFIMLNPSTADAAEDDQTIRKCIGFAKHNRFGGIMVTNLFAYRATQPALLKIASDPIGPDNDAFLRTELLTCNRTVAAWGNHGKLLRRDVAVRLMAGDAGVTLYRLGTLTGQLCPRHPVYLPYATELQPWS